MSVAFSSYRNKLGCHVKLTAIVMLSRLNMAYCLW